MKLLRRARPAVPAAAPDAGHYFTPLSEWSNEFLRSPACLDELAEIVNHAIALSALRRHEAPECETTAYFAQTLLVVQMARLIPSDREELAHVVDKILRRSHGRQWVVRDQNEECDLLISSVQNWLNDPVPRTGHPLQEAARSRVEQLHRRRVRGVRHLAATFVRSVLSPYSAFRDDLARAGVTVSSEQIVATVAAALKPKITTQFMAVPDPRALIRAGLRAMGLSAKRTAGLFAYEKRRLERQATDADTP